MKRTSMDQRRHTCLFLISIPGYSESVNENETPFLHNYCRFDPFSGLLIQTVSGRASGFGVLPLKRC